MTGTPQPEPQFMPDPTPVHPPEPPKVISAGAAVSAPKPEEPVIANTIATPGQQEGTVFVDANLFKHSRDAYLFKYADVSVPEWAQEGGPVPHIRVRELTEAELVDYRSALPERQENPVAANKKYGTPYAAFAARCMIDAKTGKNLIPTAQIAQETKKMPKWLIERLFDKAMEVNGLGKPADDTEDGDSGNG